MDRALFDELPEHSPPEPAGGRRLRLLERRQVELRALSLDQLIAADHRVRLVWRFVEGLELSPLCAGIKSVEGRGRVIRRPTRASWWRCGCMRRWRGSAAAAPRDRRRSRRGQPAPGGGA